MEQIVESQFYIRLFEQKDNKQVEELILKVMGEYGCIGEGYSSSDPEVEDMFNAYKDEKHVFYVVADSKNVYGVGGIAPLQGGNSKTCELRKMYFYKELRGMGFGRQMMDLLLEEAKKMDFKKCYLETLSTMEKAKKIYLAYGFKSLKKNIGNTGHGGCDSYYSKDL